MSGLPLSGIRVVDLTLVWAGPFATQFLADWGAEVIRFEPITANQNNTRFAERVTTREMQIDSGRRGIAGGGGYPDFEPGEDPWNRNSGFNSGSLSKLSATADIMTEAGRDLLYRLVAVSDIVVENNVPETIERGGVTYDKLREVKEDIILCRMPGFGLSGPYRNYRAFGTHIEGMIGHHYLRGYPDGLPEEAGDVFTCDAIAGVQAALAVMMALRHRRRTGQGQQIEVSQAENFLPVLGEQILDWTMNRRDDGPQGNLHPSHAPHQAYPCQGDDQWIAIDVATDAEFVSLCDVLGLTKLVSDIRFAGGHDRWLNRGELDSILAEQTRRWEKFDLFHRLQGAGVTSGPLQGGADRLNCPQLQHRNFFEEVEGPATGRHLYQGVSWKMARTSHRTRTAAPMIGQDNAYVFKELIGLSDEEYQKHRDSGMIGESYSPEFLAKLRRGK